MNKLNLSSDLFIGKAELQRLSDFLSVDTFKKLLVYNSYSFGIIKIGTDTDFDNFKIESGTNTGTIKIATASYALDKNGEIIYKEIEDNIALVDDGQWYWVKISYQADTNEVGTVSIDTQGNLTGSGTAFEDVLRGQSNHPSRIKFTDGSLNTGEYVVQEVISDTSAVLLGTFQSESDLRYAVVGTFTPGVYPTSNEKYPFQYSGTLPVTVAGGGLVLETVLNTPPSKTDGEEFYIARVRRSGSSVTIQDKRTEFWQLRSEYINSYIDRSDTNALIGVESIKYNNQYSTLDSNLIQIGWGMRSTNWVVNSELRRVTIVSAGESGKFKDVSDFTDGDFDGWRLYAVNGTYKKITSSALSGGQINLILDSLEPDDYTASDELVIVPDVESVQIRFRYDASGGEIGNIESVHTFPVKQGYGIMKIIIPVNTGTYSYNVHYRYKLIHNYTDWILLPSDTTNGYYDETSFDSDGVLKAIIDRNRKTYTQHATNGYIEFISNGSNYYNIVSALTRGDTFGVNRVNLSDSGNNPEYTLEVGTSEQVQIFENSDTLDADWFIILEDGIAEQNEFYLVFENTITLSGFNLRVVENYVNASTYDELVDIDAFLVTQASNQNLIIKCTWDGSTWHVFQHISFRDVVFGQISNTITEGNDNRFGGGYLSVTGTSAFDQTLGTDVKSVLINLSGLVTDSFIRVPNPAISNAGMRIIFDLTSVMVDYAEVISIETVVATVIKQWTNVTFENALLIIYSDGSTWHIEYELYEATASQKGIAEALTNAEALTGTDTERFMTAAGNAYVGRHLTKTMSGSETYTVASGVGRIFIPNGINNCTIRLPNVVTFLGQEIIVETIGSTSGSVVEYPSSNALINAGLGTNRCRFISNGTNWLFSVEDIFDTSLACPFVYINGQYFDEILKNFVDISNTERLDITDQLILGKNTIVISEEKDEITHFEKLYVNDKLIFKNLILHKEDKYQFEIEYTGGKVELIGTGYYVRD